MDRPHTGRGSLDELQGSLLSTPGPGEVGRWTLKQNGRVMHEPRDRAGRGGLASPLERTHHLHMLALHLLRCIEASKVW